MSSYSLRFFGSGVITDQNGQPIPMRSRKQLGLLAYLSAEHQLAHSRETLMALFWPDESSAAAQNNLRVTLSRLRELAGRLAAGVANELFIADRSSIQLHPTWVARADVNHFNQLLAGTRQHAHRSRSQCAHCQPDLQQAIQHYQGDFLAGFGLDDCPAFEEWLFMQRERLHLLLIEAYGDLAAYAETSGDLSAARRFAQHQIEIDPLREPAYRQQMRILMKQGERSLALATFERCRTVLRDELGLDPEAETLALHTQILSSGVSGGTGNKRAQAEVEAFLADASVVIVAPRTNLPQQLTPFIGREEEIAQLHVRLADPVYRLVSIVGPGGIGKSRLAQQVAAQHLNRFADGVYFVSLAQAPTVASIPAAIVETLGLAFAATQKSPAEQLFEMLSARQLLLVLDNFEHLMDGVDLLVALLQRAPKVVLIVTSRERLNLQAEDLFELQGLPTPVCLTDADAPRFAAVRLFADRAHRLDKHFKLTAEQLPHVVQICQLVEGFPLAIELAATWIRDLTCQEIVAEVAAGLDRLETTLRDVDPQHRSLRAVFNASWRLLSAAERCMLAKLTVFRGGFSLDAARAIAEAAPILLGVLRNKSLLRSAGSRRYDMHALVHQFSAETLATDAPTAARAQQTHTQYFMTLLAEQALALDTRQARAASDRIQPDWENVVAAWQQATTQAELDLLHNALDGLVYFCDLRGLFLEAQTLLARTLAQLPSAQNRDKAQQLNLAWLNLQCRLLTALAYFSGRRGLDSTLDLAQQALDLACQIECQPEIISNLIIQAATFELAADYPQGILLAEKALHMAQTAKLDRHTGLCLDLLGNIALLAGEFDRAYELFQRVLVIHEQTGRLEQRGRAAVGYLGLVAAEQGRYDVALQYNQRYLESCEAMADRHNTAHAQHYLAYVWLRLGYFARAIAFDIESAARAGVMGDRDLRSFALHTQSWAYRHLGQLPEALRCATEAVVLARALDAPLTLAFALAHLAEAQMEAAATADEWAQAAANFQEAAVTAHTIGKLIAAYEAEIGLAELARRRGDIAAARQQIAPILPHLPTVAAVGWDEPLRAYVVCTQVLRAAQDPAAEQILDQGLHLLDCLANNITDRNLRQNFLHVVPAHCKLRALQFAEQAV